jgi:hypothetical protein
MSNGHLDTLRWRRAWHAAFWRREERIEGARIGNQGDAKVTGERSRAASMVGVLMCNQNCADILLLDVRLVQAAFQLSQSEAIVHQNSCGVVLHEDGIPIAAAAK